MTEITLSPAQQFAQRVESLAQTFLVQITSPERVAMATGRLALALRQAAASNPKIYECTPASVAECVAKSAMTELFPGGPQPLVYLIPRGGKLEWQISARGLQALAGRNGWTITARVAHTEDTYEVVSGTVETIRHVPMGGYPTTLQEIGGVYVVGTHTSGLRVVADVPLGVIERRRKTAQSQNIWAQWPVEMAQKTAIVWAISRGYFGSLEQSEEMQYVQSSERSDTEPARGSYARPAAIEHVETGADFEAALDAVEVPHD